MRTAGVCFTQCDACAALGRGLPWGPDVRDILVDTHRKHLEPAGPRPPAPPAPGRLPALPVVLGHPDRAAELVHRYVAGRGVDGTPLYTGSAFDRLAGGGDRPEVVNVFTADDLVAVSMLSVQVAARAALRILTTDAERLSSYLADVPADVDLADADEKLVAEGSAADQLWWALYGLPGVGSVTAYKLVARKRPRLLAVLDSVVRQVLDHPKKGYWRNLHGELRADGGRLADRLDAIRRGAGLDGSISTIRVFDVVVWMTGKGARPAEPRTGPELVP